MLPFAGYFRCIVMIIHGRTSCSFVPRSQNAEKEETECVFPRMKVGRRPAQEFERRNNTRAGTTYIQTHLRTQANAGVSCIQWSLMKCVFHMTTEPSQISKQRSQVMGHGCMYKSTLTIQWFCCVYTSKMCLVRK